MPDAVIASRSSKTAPAAAPRPSYAPRRTAGILIAGALALASCTQAGAPAVPSASGSAPSDALASPASSAPTDGGAYEPVTIENCGDETTYAAPPERAVPMDQTVTEIMLALGLQERIVGYARVHFDRSEPVLPEFQAAYDQLELLAETSPSREIFLEAEPDFALAAFGFSEDSGLSEEALEEDGIPTYLVGDQCDGRTEPVGFEDAFTTLRDVGAIFGLPDRAEALIADMEATLEAVGAEVEGEEPVSVFVFDSGDDAPFTVGGLGMSNAMIEAAGGENVFADLDDQFVDANWEQVLERDPDVIVIMEYFHGDDGEDTDAKRAVLEARLGETTALREDRVIELPLTGFFVGVRNADVVEELAKFLHQ
ncbi:MAG: ABC transporter substrate-binding protein [Chloroflexota bacterium]|nr:ABC transporter substrate-binding protein [Chloroflexota bacterium]